MFRITVMPAGASFEAGPGQTVLDAALAAGVTLPHSCKDGVCSTCKGRVIAGEHVLGRHQPGILSEAERENGVTLLCRTEPRSDLVVEAQVVAGLAGVEVRKFPVRVQALEQVTADVMIVTLQLPGQGVSFRAGQYVDVLLPDGRRRSYSLATPPGQGKVELHIRHQPGGVFTDRVFGLTAPALRLKEILRCEGPLGTFFLREERARPRVFVAGGTGFAPVQGMLEQQMLSGDTTPAVVYWGGRRPGDFYRAEWLAAQVAQHDWLRWVPVVSDALPEDGWAGRTGWVHAAVLQDLPDLSGHDVYACGGVAMVDAARAAFTAQGGLPEDAFFADAFVPAVDAGVGA